MTQSDSSDFAGDLEKLQKLRIDGCLSDAEFAQLKEGLIRKALYTDSSQSAATAKAPPDALGVQMPSNVSKFFWLNCLSLAIGVVVAVLAGPQMAQMAEKSSALGGMTFVITVQIFSFVILLLLIWLIAYRKRNWARWVFVVMFLTGLPSVLGTFKDQPGISIQGGFSLVQLGLLIASLYFIFTGNAVGWFKRAAEPPR